jgi:hypothetical protein
MVGPAVVEHDGRAGGTTPPPPRHGAVVVGDAVLGVGVVCVWGGGGDGGSGHLWSPT